MSSADRFPAARFFWAKVRKTETCWVWMGALNRWGYGYHGKGLAHRASWVLHNGDIPEGLCVLHHCDFPTCVRPDHLFLGTQADNVADCVAKGRYPRGADRGGAKLDELRVAAMILLWRRGVTQRWIARFYGVPFQLVCKIVNGKTWKYLYDRVVEFDTPAVSAG